MSTRTINEILALAGVVPVLTIERAADAEPLAKALVAGGLSVFEVTLRTREALDCIPVIRTATPDAVIGVGTLLNPGHVEQAVIAGADFLVSPGYTQPLLQALVRTNLPALPGVATPTESIIANEAGFSTLKFFPAEYIGGIEMLKVLRGPLPHLMFCPTGGISREMAGKYLELPNVAAVGGSWIATPQMIAAGDWAGIEANARAAATMRDRRPALELA
jgi:2-dehydro-3-deoxyphosphogluconate aldolase/(4S)-4-hydroxy-2-oxoglutarate aldolase